MYSAFGVEHADISKAGSHRLGSGGLTTDIKRYTYSGSHRPGTVSSATPTVSKPRPMPGPGKVAAVTEDAAKVGSKLSRGGKLGIVAGAGAAAGGAAGYGAYRRKRS